MHELKKLEIREDKQQLNEFVFLAALPWLVGAGMSAYDYYKLRGKNQGKPNPADWDTESQLELGAGLAGTVAGGVLGRYLGKGVGWLAGKGWGAVKGTGTGAAAGVKAVRQAKKAAEKIKKTPDTVKGGRRTPGGQFKKGSNVKVTPRITAAIGAGARAGMRAAAPIAGKSLARLGMTAGFIKGREAGKELGSQAGWYSGDSKDDKDSSAKPTKTTKPKKSFGGYYADNPELVR